METVTAIRLPSPAVALLAQGAARRELRVIKDAIERNVPLVVIWFDVYLDHHLYLRQFLELSHTQAFAYVSARFARLCAGMPSDAEFLAEAEAGLRALILETNPT